MGMLCVGGELLSQSCWGVAELLENLLAEENVMDVVGALEYDPELAARQNHRQFLREHVIFKEVSYQLPGCVLISILCLPLVLPRHTCKLPGIALRHHCAD